MKLVGVNLLEQLSMTTAAPSKRYMSMIMGGLCHKSAWHAQPYEPSYWLADWKWWHKPLMIIHMYCLEGLRWSLEAAPESSSDHITRTTAGRSQCVWSLKASPKGSLQQVSFFDLRKHGVDKYHLAGAAAVIKSFSKRFTPTSYILWP